MKLDEHFIEKYTADLESKVLQHLNHDNTKWNLRKAHEYLVKTVEILFGNEKHSGIVQYILDNQKHLKLTTEEAVKRAENLYAKGWSIKEVRGRFFLLDDNFSEVEDITGSADVAPTGLLIEEFGLDNAFMFLREEDLNSLVQVAKKHEIDLSNLKSPEFTYDLVLKKEGPKSKVFPVAQGYQAIGELLRKVHHYESDDYENLFSLYEEGYRLSPKINPSSYTRVYLSKGKEEIAVIPVSGGMVGEYYEDDLLVDFYSFLEEVFTECEVQIPERIGELGQVYALSLRMLPYIINNQDLGEVIRLLNSMKSQKQAKNYPHYDKILKTLVQIFSINTLVIGNSTFNLSSVGIDHVSPKVYIKFSGIFPLENKAVMDKFYANAGNSPTTEKDPLNVILRGTDYDYLSENFQTILPYLDDDFQGKLEKYEGSDELSSRIKSFLGFLRGEK